MIYENSIETPSPYSKDKLGIFVDSEQKLRVILSSSYVWAENRIHWDGLNEEPLVEVYVWL